MSVSPELIQKGMADGNWKPNMYLTNVSIAYLQKPENYAKGLRLFPRVPVPLSAGHYYKFDKAYGHKLRGGQLYTASAPGEAPAVRTGILRLSFKRRYYSTKEGKNFVVHAMTESGLKEGKHLLGELLDNGTNRMKPRPFKERTKQLAMPKIERIFNEPYIN